ncbi:MAG: glycosyltransferase, partial [Gemmatimonas sp.]
MPTPTAAPAATASPVRSSAQEWRSALVWILGALLLRTGLAALVPLLPDETYYWEWSRRLEAGYFDHPPGIALLIAFGTALFGDTHAGVRAGPAMAALL